MPFSKAPITSTYETKRIPFVLSPQQRLGSLSNKDPRLVNVMVEALENPLPSTPANKRVVVKSRAGMSTVYNTTTGVGRGIYYWVLNGVAYTFAAVGTGVYVNGVLKQTLTTSTGDVNFTEFITDTGVKSLIMVDGVKGYYWPDPTIAPTEITDGDFPTPHIPQPIYFDGYLFLAKANTADVYNSDLNDPTAWTAGNFISAEMFPDIIVGLAKNNNYINVIGSSSIEYFHDAANATGSPLSRQPGVVQQFGCASGQSIVATEKEVIFVGETSNGGHTVWTLNGFKEEEISTPMVKGVLLSEGANLATATAHCIRVSGQKLYVLCLTTRTLVYSFETKLWSEWDSGATGGTVFIGTHGGDGPRGTAYILDKSNGKVYAMAETYVDDAGTAFQCSIVTAKSDFDVMDNKFMSRLSIIGDIPDSTMVDNNISVEWSDDDYNTWSTPRNLNIGADQPAIRQLGRFRRRAFRFKYALNHLLRLDSFEVDINKGSQ